MINFVKPLVIRSLKMPSVVKPIWANALAYNAAKNAVNPVFLAQVRGVKADCPPKRVNQDTGLQKFRQMQEKFQREDGKPIFLKGGASDVLLYRSTWALALVGLSLNILFFLGYILK